MRYINAPNVAYGEDRRTYKVGVNGVEATDKIFNVSYDNGRVEAYLNGVRLFPTDDYTKASSGIGTSITLISDLGANNVLEIVGYQGINSGNALVEDNFIVGTSSTGSGGAYGGSTTVFNVASSAGDTVSVWRNGVKLVPTTDFTVDASASEVELGSEATSADEITVQVVGGVIHNNGLTVNSSTNSFSLPTTRGADGQALTRTGTSSTTWTNTVVSPVITSITYPTESSVVTTALEASGSSNVNENLLINGTGFTSTVTVQIQVSGIFETFSASTSVNSAGTIITCTNVTKRAAADNYPLRVINSSGLNVDTTVNFSADPSFTTGATLPSVYAGATLDQDIVVTGDGTITWTEGSPAMPTWMTHFANGDTGTTKTLTGTTANTGASTTHSFNIIIKDSQDQSHNRTFSLSVIDAPLLTGSGNVTGTVTVGSTTYRWAKFVVSGDLTFYINTDVHYLLVGGGGGAGAGWYAGGGGAGGLLTSSSAFTCTASTTYSIVVGTGGDGALMSGGNDNGNDGVDTTAFGLAAAQGGGAGGGITEESSATGSGGSSGGGSYNGGSQPIGTAVSGQGNIGGIGGNGAGHSGGGGGGAGAVGESGATAGTAGGVGKDEIMGMSDSDTHTFLAGVSAGHVSGGTTWFAGGGAGATQSGSVSAGGLGGGGAGGAAYSAIGQDATDGTGGGGGGGGGLSGAADGGDGGNGIVILRYAL